MIGSGDLKHAVDVDDAAFEKYLSALRGQVGEAKYKSWFLDLGLAEQTQETVTLTTPSESKRDILDNRYLPMLIDLWRREIGPVSRVKLTVRSAALSANAAMVAERNMMSRLDSAATPAAQFNSDSKTSDSKSAASNDVPALAAPLDPRRTFHTLAVGDSNRIAAAAVRQALSAATPAEIVYVFGDSGVGKTHLLQAACHGADLDANAPASLYVTYRNLINACVSAALSNNTRALHEVFLSNDIVAVDDVHFLDGKDRTQEELLIAIDALLDTGKSVVVAGDRAPSKLAESGIKKRLADRLAGGLCVQVHGADETMRYEILRKRAETTEAKCTISDDLLNYVARNFSTSTREAIGALNQVFLIYREEQREIGIDDAETFLSERLKDNARPRLANLDDAIVAGAEAFGLTPADIVGRAQPQRIVRARHAIVLCAREVLTESFPRIGKALRRDHTTVMSSYRRAQALIERDKAFQDGVRRIREALES